MQVKTQERSPTKREKSRRRRAFEIIAILLVLAMLLTGTFAWQSISQQALNQTIGIPAPAGGRLHNDQEVVGARHGTREWAAGRTSNHDVYVENFEGDEITALEPAFGGRNIFARVRIYEYMEIGTGANLLPGEHEYDIRLDRDGGRVRPLVRYAPNGTTLTDRDNPATWTPFIPGNANTNLFRQYWDLNMGGHKWYMPTFNRDVMSRMSDVKGDAWDPQHAGFVAATEPANPTRRFLADGTTVNPTGFSADAGLHNYFTPAAVTGGLDNTTHTAPVKRWNENFATGVGNHALLPAATHNSHPTFDGEFMLMADWLELDPEDRVRPAWVMDADGWAYWAQPIMPNGATGLLINNITLTERPQEQWFYDIFVNAQMATAEEWREDAVVGNLGWFHPDAGPAPSTNAVTLMDALVDVSDGFGDDFTVTPATANVMPGGSQVFEAEFNDTSNVIWTFVTPGTHENTTITLTGSTATVNVAAAETLDTIVIRATRPEGMVRHAVVTVGTPTTTTTTTEATTTTETTTTTTTTTTAAPAIPDVATELRTVDCTHGGGTFLEIATSGDYSLILRTEVEGGTTRTRNAWGAGDNEVRNRVNTWFTNLNASSNLRPHVVANNSLTQLGTWSHGDGGPFTVTSGFSAPIPGTEGSIGVNTAFVLSSQEAGAFVSQQWDSAPSIVNGGSGGSWMASSAAAQANWAALADETTTDSWLRSPGDVATTAGILHAHGGVNTNFVSSSRSVRPALWVNSDIFD